ncbi:hypothetical protein MASSI9I_50884 [Massilia sp. 9I]|nr:hypothetical protein MASSI9I_50884 [Massilia sp. 9I]
MYFSTMKAVQRMFSAWRRFFFVLGCNKLAHRHFELRGQRLATSHAHPHPVARFG